MIVQITIPMLDTRRILNAGRKDLVHAPNWYEFWNKDDDNAYLRRIGHVVERPSTGKLKLPMESLCVDAFRKLDAGTGLKLSCEDRSFKARPLFFRLFWDSYFACRFDLGFKIPHVRPEEQIVVLSALVKSEIGVFGQRAGLLNLGPILESTLSKATDLTGKSQEGVLALKPSIFVQLPFSEVHRSALLDEVGEFMEESVHGIARELRLAPSYQKKFEIARLAANGEMKLESAKGKTKFSVWVIPERKQLNKAALDPVAVARQMRITIAKLQSERMVLQSATAAATDHPEYAAAVLQAVEATIESVENRPLSRMGIATNDASYGEALKTKAFTIERHFAVNQYHKLEVYRQQSLAEMKAHGATLTNISAAGDITIYATLRAIEDGMSNDKPTVQFGDLHAGRDIIAPIGDGASITTGASYQAITAEEWKMLSEELPKISQAIVAEGVTSENLKAATAVSEAAEAADKKDEKTLLDNLKTVGGKVIEVAEKIGSAALLGWLKVRFGV